MCETCRNELQNYEKPTDLWPICMWVFAGDSGNLLCLEGTAPDGTCGASDCFGCPTATRKINGKLEYWRPPIHGSRCMNA